MNLGNAMDAPNEGDWGPVLAESDFVAMREAGFDHIRLPVRFDTHARPDPPYTLDPGFLDRVDWAIDQALRNNLAIIVDMHHYEPMEKTPDTERPRFLALWRQVAARFRSRPDSVVFEVLNEPNSAMTANKWNPILADAIKIIRASNPTRLVIAEGVEWASAKNLRDTLDIPEGDPNIIGSFHMYQPILFTHQGGQWMGPEFQTKGLVFPGPPPKPVQPVEAARNTGWTKSWFDKYNADPPDTNPGGPFTIREQLGMAQAWQDEHHLPVYMGEFGAIKNADDRSRETWLRMTRQEAEKHGFGWAYWDDAGDFMAYDRGGHSWVPYLKSALLQ
jgi:endoglucanase